MWVPSNNRDWLRLFWWAIRVSFQKRFNPSNPVNPVNQVNPSKSEYDWKPPVRWL